MSTSCLRCGAVVTAEEVCPGCLADFVFEPAEELERLGPYRLLGILGQGGMGVVYRAEHIDLGKAVALKVLRPHLTQEEQERFRREAQTLAKVRHPNVVSIHDFGFERGWFWFVMDLVTGKPLASVAGLRKAALAVQHLHEQGIVHRDLKPQNVLVDEAGEPRIVDFGLAKTGDASLTPTNALLGTPAYMAPEQARGAEPDARSDVYALGAVLYELLTGHPPFTGTPTEVIRRVLDEDPPVPPGEAGLVRVCMKALAKVPSRRYATAREFADDLGRALEGSPVRAPRPRLRRIAMVVVASLAIAITILLAAQKPEAPTIEIRDKNARDLIGRGKQEYAKGDWWRASAFFEKCAAYLEQEGTEPGALRLARTYAALCRWRLGRAEDAFSEMRAAGWPDEPADDEAWQAMRRDARWGR